MPQPAGPQDARDCVVLGETRHAPRLYQALAPYAGRAAAADRHYRAAAGCHRRLGARPMLAHTLHEHARLLPPSAASAALAEARAIAADCGMTKLLAVLDKPGQRGDFTLHREDDFWFVGFANADARVPDSLSLRDLDLLIRHPGRELAALDLVQQARTAYRQRLTTLDEDLAEAEAWHDTERARLNVTRAIRSAIARIRDRAPAAATHLDQSVRTGTRCSYSPPNG